MLATATTVGNDYVVGIASRLASMLGWADDEVAALRSGNTVGDNDINALTDLIREAAANAGTVTETTWKAAQDAGWTDHQLAEAFACLGLTVFTGYFLNYAQTEMDV